MSDDHEHPDPHLETVLETSDPDLVPIIKSMLEGAEIPYVMDGAATVDLFPAATMMPVLSDQKGELVFKVPADRLEEAKGLLSEDFDLVAAQSQESTETAEDDD